MMGLLRFFIWVKLGFFPTTIEFCVWLHPLQSHWSHYHCPHCYRYFRAPSCSYYLRCCC